MPDTINLRKYHARVKQEPDGRRLFLVMHGAEILCSEYDGDWGNWLAEAWAVLDSGRPAAWKTTKMLSTLRQAFRENFAQGMGLEAPRYGAGAATVREFLRQARARTSSTTTALHSDR